MILRTFAPPKHAWTDQLTDVYDDEPYGYYGIATITDEYDFRSAVLNEHTWEYPYPEGLGSSYRAFTWKQVVNPAGGAVHRIKFTFSLSALPPTGKWYSIVNLRFNTSLATDPNDSSWGDRLVLIIYDTGKLQEVYYSQYTADGAISPGTEYDVEIVQRMDRVAGTRTLKVYLDGVLTLSGSRTFTMTPLPAYAELMAGIDWAPAAETWTEPGPEYVIYVPRDATLHMEDIVWTIESDEVTTGHWTMITNRFM